MKYRVQNPSQTQQIAAELARRLRGGEVIWMEGDLGAGKTTFVKGLAAALGVEEVVTSPTFTFLRSYRGRALTLHHFDLYRAQDADALYELGLAEYLGESDAVCVIEWNKLESPVEPIRVRIRVVGDTEREIEIV